MSTTNSVSERILILGTTPLSWQLAEIIADLPLGYGIVGFVHDDYNTGGVLPRNKHNENGHGNYGNGYHYNGNGNGNGNGHGLLRTNGNAYKVAYSFPIIGPMDRLENVIKDLRPHRIIVPFSDDAKLPAQALLNSRIQGVVVEDANELYERLTRKLAIENLPPSLLIFSKDLVKPWLRRILRRAFSLAVASLGLLVAAPLLLLIGLAIRLDSEGPVFFIQDREGYRRRPFRMLKFRTMHPADHEERGWNRDVLSRVTRVGKWLRRYHLDELPQLINVMRGEMDVVGPRPEMACNVQGMSEQIPYYSLRTIIRPGMTGWAQIKNGYSVSEIEVTEKIRYDLYYVKHMSLWFDVRILCDTLRIILFGPKQS